MARSAEKAVTQLARWRDYIRDKESGGPQKRPYLATECKDLKKALKWRGEIIGEISKKVAQVQNAGLGEFRLRDLNDEINKLLREKRHWENQISDLGGPTFNKFGPKVFDDEGKEVPINRGYRYFGAARDLPGVKDLFATDTGARKRKTRTELARDVDAEYFGYHDEDDGVIVPLERRAERKAQAQAVEEWRTLKEAKMSSGESGKTTEDPEAVYAPPPDPLTDSEDSDVEDDSDAPTGAGGKDGVEKQQAFVAHVPVPSQAEVEEALVQRKKMALLQQYASDALVQESEQAKALLGLT